MSTAYYWHLFPPRSEKFFHRAPKRLKGNVLCYFSLMHSLASAGAAFIHSWCAIALIDIYHRSRLKATCNADARFRSKIECTYYCVPNRSYVLYEPNQSSRANTTKPQTPASLSCKVVSYLFLLFFMRNVVRYHTEQVRPGIFPSAWLVGGLVG